MCRPSNIAPRSHRRSSIAPSETTHVGRHRPRNHDRGFVATQIELIRSPVVIAQAIQDPRLKDSFTGATAEETIRGLSAGLVIEPINNSGLCEVALDGPYPEHNTKVVNAVVDAYFRVRHSTEEDQSHRVLELLKDEKEARAKQLQELRAEVRRLSHEIVGTDPFTGTPTSHDDLVQTSVTDLQQQLGEAEAEERLISAQLAALKEASKRPANESANTATIELALAQSPEIQSLQAELAARNAQLARIETASKYGKEDTSYQRTLKEIQRVEAALAEAKKMRRPKMQADLAATAANARQAEIERLETMLASQQAVKNMLQQRLRDRVDAMGNPRDGSVKLEFARAELARQQRVFDLISERTEALRVELAGPGRATLLQPAEVPTIPFIPLPLKSLVVAVFLSLVLPCGLAIFWEHVVRRISDTDQLQKTIPSAISAEVCRMPSTRALIAAAAENQNGSQGHPSSGANGNGDAGVSSVNGKHKPTREIRLFRESVDSLRTCLFLNAGEDAPQIVAVTSAVPDEGKTSVATQLALSIGKATGRRTLLVDADLRDPDLADAFGTDHEPGLADVLAGACPLADALLTSSDAPIDLLPAGRAKVSPHQLFGNGDLEEVLKELRKQYAYIVFDTPPVLAAGEALVITRHVDATVFCARRHKSREATFHRAIQRLEATGAMPSAVVLTGVSAGRYAYRYGEYASN